MQNPFPGMNPYLEAHWRDVHTSLMVYIRDQLQTQLPDDLTARVEESVSIDAGEDSREVSPDVRVVEEPSGWPTEGGTAVATATIVVADPLLIRVDEPPTPRHVEIVEPKSGNRVVTAIEVISPTNKRDDDGRKAYRRKQLEYLDSTTNLVEIDLLRGGEHVVAVSPTGVKPSRRAPCYVCIRRAWRHGWSEVVPLPLRERLPAVRIPLRRTDRDVILNLQELIDQCYQRGRYSSIDYRRDSDPPLTGEDAAWADALLRSKRLR
jgi:hypothetical protein